VQWRSKSTCGTVSPCTVNKHKALRCAKDGNREKKERQDDINRPVQKREERSHKTHHPINDVDFAYCAVLCVSCLVGIDRNGRGTRLTIHRQISRPPPMVIVVWQSFRDIHNTYY
jgi:hypothetical protein